MAIAGYQQSGGIGVYKASQTPPASLGTQWQAVTQDGVQQLVYVGPNSDPDQITILNNSGNPANLGIGMSGAASVFQNGVLDGESAQFTVKPLYFAGLFENVELGEVIDSNVSVGPFPILFDGGNNSATLTASVVGGSLVTTLTYSQLSTTITPMSTIERRRQGRNALKAA